MFFDRGIIWGPSRHRKSMLFDPKIGCLLNPPRPPCLMACRSHPPNYNPSNPPIQGEGLPSPYPLPTGSSRRVVGTSEGVAPLQAPPRRPKTPPRRFQDDPRRLLDAPRRSKMPPRRPQDAPRHPKTLQDAPKTPPRRDFGGFGEPKPKQVGTKIVSSRDFMLK